MPVYHIDTTRSAKRFCNKWWILALAAVIIGIILIIVSVTIKASSQDYDYGIIFDAGSSHTNMFIYKWLSSKVNDTGEVHEIKNMECSEKGISQYVSNFEKVETTVTKCLDTALTLIPENHHKRTIIFMGATAGMRLLEAFNKSQSDAIFEKVKETSQKYPFIFKDAKIISGEEEGAGAWITVNYILGNLIHHSQTVGALDLGGASTQIAFQPLTKLSEAKKKSKLQLFGTNYPLYAHSFLCYGKNEIEKRYSALLVKKNGYQDTDVPDPCAPLHSTYIKRADQLFEHVCTAGKYARHSWGSDLSPPTATDPNKNYTFQGTSAVSECETIVKEMFNFSCSYDTCSYNNIYQPPIEGNFMAFSSFYYVMSFFNQTEVKNITTLLEVLENYCKKSWEEINVHNAGEAEWLKFYCFQGWYIKDMLTIGYGFNASTWQKITFLKKVNGQSAGWTTGIMLNLTNEIPVPEEAKPSYFYSPTFLPLVIIGSIILLVAVIFAVLAFNMYRSQSSMSP